MIGKQLSPILEEIENTLWEFEMRNFGNPQFTDEGFRAALKIFMSAILDKMWNIQNWDKVKHDMATLIDMLKDICGSNMRLIISGEKLYILDMTEVNIKDLIDDISNKNYDNVHRIDILITLDIEKEKDTNTFTKIKDFIKSKL